MPLPAPPGHDQHDAQIIWLHHAAPEKPALGAACNGCGVCCAAMPCPLSRALLRHRRDACPALQWQVAAQQYRCGLMLDPEPYLPWLPRWGVPLLQRLARRYLALGSGCDTDATTESA